MRMQGVARKAEHALVFRRPAFRDELQVKVRVRAVNLVTQHRVPDVRQVHAQLMQPAGMRPQPQKG